jgi:hypothetical protein
MKDAAGPGEAGFEPEAARAALARAATEPGARRRRRELVIALTDALQRTGDQLQVGGFMIGFDRAAGTSPCGNGDDALVGLARLCQTAAALASGSTSLLAAGNGYAASALTRQLVEVEYLAWAFGNDEEEARSWLRSSKQDRLQRWQPRHLRERSAGRFRGSDYGEHCEYGGHPTPDGCRTLLTADDVQREILLYEVLHHGWSTWQYLLLAVVQHAVRTGADPKQLVADSLARAADHAEAEWRAVERLGPVWGGLSHTAGDARGGDPAAVTVEPWT